MKTKHKQFHALYEDGTYEDIVVIISKTIAMKVMDPTLKLNKL